jgi:hypothetical protein
MKRVNYRDITLAGGHRGMFLLRENVEAVSPAETSQDVTESVLYPRY